MQLGSDVQIPDGLLAANALLREKPHQGVPSWKSALHQGIDERNSTAAIGLRAGLLLNRVESRSTGKERDAESGLDYFGARYMSSSMGRFMSPDWSAQAEPVPYAKLDNPQSLNLYAYVGNNPLRFADPDGHVQKDKDGNVIFTATGTEHVTFIDQKLKDGSTLKVGWDANTGYIKADDGTKIAASQATSGLQVSVTSADGKTTTQVDPSALGGGITGSGNTADCHGTTFANGQVWINNDQVGKLIKGDGYSMTSNPQVGDVGVYTQNGKLSSTDHSVSVLSLGAGGVSTVGSKGGITPYTVTTPGKGWYDPNDKLTYYTQHPQK
jgi:RHS repeat-associated protein